ncbi:hypothetical protein QWY16_17835 [Planococcus shenhongbingii]|uniref:hypothetical protein n=1 Tax=Planococcus shenhongbingii TaxID=3058398 RepID=UPI00260CECDE|nr:hypothetical protein [Planococcus sp. N016]WKA58333.1 hypothetical protein QWY16_17835 [Planococcus sp. N016]
MILFKRTPLLTDKDKIHLKQLVGKTVEAMLQSKEETLYIMEKYELVFICSWEGEYIDCSLYHRSSINVFKSGKIGFQKEPIFTEKRYFHKKNDTLIYLDKNQLMEFPPRNLEAFYYTCELVQNFEIEVNSVYDYTCVW